MSPQPPADAYKRAGDRPVYISVPSVGINAPVVPTGRAGTGMAVTKDPMIADWLGVGTYPGDQGSAVIAGHSGFAHSFAAFDPLPGVRVGDSVVVRLKSGSNLVFKVTSIRRFHFDAQVPDVFDRNDGRYLNLISCTGTWNPAAHTHNLRLVVFTRLS